MTIYLPIAEMSVSLFLILGIGGAVGFVSGMFGVGGGFLMTPLLIFSGIPPAVVVASEASQIAASACSGAFSYWRRSFIDFRLSLWLMLGGVLGSLLGVWLFSLLRNAGQLDIFIALSYVVLLGFVGSLMLWESVGALLKLRRSAHLSPYTHTNTAATGFLAGFGARLPWQMSFPSSKLKMSILPILLLGFCIGLIGSMLGVGGGFLLVPALIYLLRVPTGLAIGTSLFQTVVTMSVASILHASTTYAVDLVLSFLLMIGGVIGAQYGAHVGQKLKGEELRALLALIILLVALRFAYEMVAEPAARFSLFVLGVGA